jgi:hypothetical protein
MSKSIIEEIFYGKRGQEDTVKLSGRYQTLLKKASEQEEDFFGQVTSGIT